MQVVRVCMHGATENMPFLVQQPLVALFCPILDEVTVLPFLAPDQLAHLLQEIMNGDTAPPTGPPKGIGREFPQWSKLWRLSPKKRADCAGRCWQIVLAYAGMCWPISCPHFQDMRAIRGGPPSLELRTIPHAMTSTARPTTRPPRGVPSRDDPQDSARGPHQKVGFF